MERVISVNEYRKRGLVALVTRVAAGYGLSLDELVDYRRDQVRALARQDAALAAINAGYGRDEIAFLMNCHRNTPTFWARQAEARKGGLELSAQDSRKGRR